MEEQNFYTVTEALKLWEMKHPGNMPSRQTFYNWAKKYGWCINGDRILVKQKMLINSKMFDEFNADPWKYLQQ